MAVMTRAALQAWMRAAAGPRAGGAARGSAALGARSQGGVVVPGVRAAAEVSPAPGVRGGGGGGGGGGRGVRVAAEVSRAEGVRVAVEARETPAAMVDS